MAHDQRSVYRLAIAFTTAGHTLRLRYSRPQAPLRTLPRRALSLDGLRALVALHPAVLSVSASLLQPAALALPEPSDDPAAGEGNPL
jgi:hypothetical protein